MIQTMRYIGTLVLFLISLEYPHSLYFLLFVLKNVKTDVKREKMLLEKAFYLYHKHKNQIIKSIANKINNSFLNEPVKIELLTEAAKLTNREPAIKYDDRYLDRIRALPCDHIVTEDEQILQETMFIEYLNNAATALMNNKTKLITEINNLKQERSDMENIEFSDNDKNFTYDQYGFKNTSFEQTIKEKINVHCEKMEELEAELNILNNTVLNDDDIKTNVVELVTNERLNKLQNNFIIEKTPLGNVLMFYNNSKKAFEYYSDNSMPYRFLEVVCRRYVLTFKCRHLYVDMKDELRKTEIKLEMKEKNDVILKEELDLCKKRLEINETNVDSSPIRKNVFAKFKSYNKDAGTGRVNKAPPKNNIPNNVTTENRNIKVLLKERANHYTCEGKIANFNMLKKVDRKQISKKYAMSFADFKKNLNNKK